MSDTASVTRSSTLTPTPDLRRHQLSASLYSSSGEKICDLATAGSLTFPVSSLHWRGGRDSIESHEDEICLENQEGELVLNWQGRNADGEPLPNGVYTIKVVVTSLSGGHEEVFVLEAVVVLPPLPPRHAVISPNPYLRGEGGNACLVVGGAARLRLRVYTIGGELLLDEMRGGERFCFNAARLAAGVYVLVVESWGEDGIRTLSITRLMVL